MTTPEKTDAEGMTGASGQRWEPADEGLITEAPNQPPPGGDDRDAPRRREPEPPTPVGKKPEPTDR